MLLQDDSIKNRVVENAKVVENRKQVFPKLPKSLSPEEACKTANSRYAKQGNNCHNAVVAFALRLCGYDVVAKPHRDGVYMENICDAFGISVWDEKRRFSLSGSNAESAMIRKIIAKRFKEGDVGAISFDYNDIYREAVRKKYGNEMAEKVSGHVVNWVIENGRVVFQDGEKNLDDAIVAHFLDNYTSKSVDIAQLLNRFEDISEDIKNRATAFVEP